MSLKYCKVEKTHVNIKTPPFLKKDKQSNLPGKVKNIL